MSEKLIWAFWCCIAALLTPPASVGQDRSAPPAHAEPNLVVIRALVLDKDGVARGGPERNCSQPNVDRFFKYSSGRPTISRFCGAVAVRGLTAKDFRIFEDGAEQKVQQVKELPRSARTIRDHMGVHNERSETPAGIWSTDDRGGVFGPIGAGSFYSITYANSKPETAGCRKLKVKVDRGHALVLAPNECCAGESPSDPLFGTKFGKQMERDLTSGEKARIDLSLRADYFYTGVDEARVNIAMEFPWNSLYRAWNTSDWRLHAGIGVLGLVYRKDGALAGRFSDFACCSADTSVLAVGWDWTAIPQRDEHGDYVVPPVNSDVKLLAEFDRAVIPARYDTQLDLPPGDYDLRVVLSDGTKFGRAETHLVINGYDGKQLALSSVALGGRLRVTTRASRQVSASRFAPKYLPLVSKGFRFTPAAETNFRKGEQLIVYFEVCEPLLVGASATVTVGAHARIVDAATSKVIKDFPAVDAAPYERPGSSTIPIARQVPFDQLPKGAYRLEVQATDSAGRSTPWRAASFTVE